MTKYRLFIECDICTEAQATHVARYHGGLLVCRGCYAEEPRPGNDDAGWYENEEEEEDEDDDEEDDWQEDEEEWKWEEYG